MFVHLFAYIYIIIFALISHEAVAIITVLDKGIFPLEVGSVGIQFYIDLENNNHLSSCKVNSWPKMCCLTDEDYKDCSSDTIYGHNEKLIKPKARATFIFVYPTLYQYDQTGSCDFVIDYKCGNTRHSRQVDINIPFDTQMVNKKKSQYLLAYSNVKDSDCESLDEDSLRQCEAVNCDLKYSGRRPYYESNRAKCVSVPVCETDVVKKLPDVAYVPKSNICRDLDHPITIGDIYAINTGLGVVTESTKSASSDLKILLKSNCSTISQNVILLKDMMYGKLCPLFNGDTSSYKDCCINALLYIVAYIIAVSALLMAIVCCLHTILWCYKKWSKGELRYSLTNWRLNTSKKKQSLHRRSIINREVTDNLLREVIVRDLPMEMRDSVVDICQRIDQEIKLKKRYRVMDLGSQLFFRKGDGSSTYETSLQSTMHDDDDYDDKAKLMK